MVVRRYRLKRVSKLYYFTIIMKLRHNGPFMMGKIPSPEGVLIFPATLPTNPPGPYSIFMQALVGSELTGLCVLEVQ